MEESRTYTVPEAAALLGVSPRHLFDVIRGGQLPAIHIGRSVRLSKAMVTRMIDEPGWQPMGAPQAAPQQPAPLTAIRGRRGTATQTRNRPDAGTSSRRAVR
jgi:excisionase family DNA binding protein